MGIVLFDNTQRQKLYPLNNVCAVADLRLGIFTMRERWKYLCKEVVHVNTEQYLSSLYEPVPPASHVWIDASVLTDESLTDRIMNLSEDEALADHFGFVAGRKNFSNNFSNKDALNNFETIYEIEKVRRLEYPWNLFQHNDEFLRSDFKLIAAKNKSRTLSATNQATGTENIFIEEGAVVEYSTINAATGPVYIGKSALVMEGCLIRGPFALCEGATLKMASKIYGATTLGPHCIGGGEIKNTVMQAFSNKAHDGYLGDAVIGRWCNLGAGTCNSNVKNTGAPVKMFDKSSNEYIPVGMKSGVIMGDYSRTGINTSLNTGTVIGTCCNVFGDGVMPNYIPDFQWDPKSIAKYEFPKAFRDIDNWKKMKGMKLEEAEIEVLKYLYSIYSE